MMRIDSATNPRRATWLVIGGFVVLAFLVATALPDAPDDPERRAEPETARVVQPATTPAPAGSNEAVAGETGATPPRSSRPERSLRPPRAPQPFSVTRTLGSLVLVLALLVGGAFVASKWLRRLRVRPGGDRVIEVLDAVPLGPKRQVYVVSVHGRRLVLGAAGERITLLSEIDEEETADVPPSFESRLDAVPAPAAGVMEIEA